MDQTLSPADFAQEDLPRSVERAHLDAEWTLLAEERRRLLALLVFVPALLGAAFLAGIVVGGLR